MDNDVINTKDLKLLVSENVSLSYLVSAKQTGYVLSIQSYGGKRVLMSQRGSIRTFRTLDAVFSFLRDLNVNKFEVQILGTDLDEKIG
ncbi:TPA: hypothetical protein ACGF4T_002161 [Vibrio cholerae]|uniref:hypothetical protein n=1 Tax=Vibrio cincinnatiensis TaxID=675 RepID=UPI0036F71D2D